MFIKLSHKIYLLLFVILFSTEYYAQEITFQKSLTKYAYGDNKEWSKKDFNDTNWNIVFNNFIPYAANKLWIRTNFFIDETSDFHNVQIILSILATYEIYWNGQLIGNNCISGSSIELKNGQFFKTFDLPDSLILKKNTLALRVNISEGEDIEIQDMLIDSQEGRVRGAFYVYGYLFVLFILHLIFLFFFINKKLRFNKLQVIYFSIILLTILFTLIYEALLYLGIISYHHNSIINTVEFYKNNLLLLGLTLFYFNEYKVKNSALYILATALFIILLNYFNASDASIYFAGLLPPIILLTWAAIKKKVAALYSLSFVLIIFSILYAWFTFTLNDISFLIFPSFFIIRKIRLDTEKVKRLHKAELRSSRLETEMLKRILQPHYIMNSLNAVLEFIEQSPKNSIGFIKELSDEFRSFLDYSDKRLISVKEEIALCKRHLKIMEYRKQKKYLLKNDIVNMNEQIPPAIFHTLIENGVTYNLNNSDSVCFLISEQIFKKGKKFIITVNYNGNCTTPTKDEEIKIKEQFNNYSKDITEGTGLKYIRSRLTETYGNNWKLDFYGNKTVWVTEIEIYNGKEQ